MMRAKSHRGKFNRSRPQSLEPAVNRKYLWIVLYVRVRSPFRRSHFEHYRLKNRSLDMIHRQERANMQISRLKWLLMPLAAIIFVTGIIAARQTRRVDDGAL